VGVILQPQADLRVRNIAEILVRQVSRRCDANLVMSARAPFKIELMVEGGIGTDGYEIADGPADTLRIVGNDVRGLLYGVGKFLRTSRYDQGGFSPSTWRGLSVPQGTFRAVYAATHFMNFYEAAPLREVKEYIEDLGLWGANAVIAHFPTWNFKGFDDPAARRSLLRIRRLFKAARDVGMKMGLIQCPNQGFTSAPKEIRAAKFPDDLRRRGSFGVNCCPSNPTGREYLMKLYAELFEEYKDVGLDYIVFWPYDEGGCGCSDCWPWGARGFPKTSKDLTLMTRTKHPNLNAVLSTWVYDTPPAGEWEGLARLLAEEKSWANYIMADSHTDFPLYPLEKGVPGGLPLLNFPEISMWGRSPWGGCGANPLPARFERLWKQTDGKLSGGMPYSEGIYEDMNKVICFQFYWEPDRRAEDTLKEYIAFEYSPDAVDELLKAVCLLEETWINIGPKSLDAHDLVKRAEAKLTLNAKSAWRWRILYLRSLIDSEMFKRGGKMEGEVLKQAFNELTRIYHAEKAHSMPVRPPVIT